MFYKNYLIAYTLSFQTIANLIFVKKNVVPPPYAIKITIFKSHI